MNLTFAATTPATVHLAKNDDGTTLLTGLAVPFGVASGPSASDGKRYIFASPPTNADELVDAVREHDTDALVGRLAQAWEQTDAGLAAKVRLFDTTRGRDVLVEARESARTGFSVGAQITAFDEGKDGTRTVTEWTADHLGIVRRPAFADAGFTLTASLAPTPTQESHMPTDTNTRLDHIEAKVAEFATVKPQDVPSVSELADLVAARLKPADNAHPLAAFASREEFFAAFKDADEDRREALSVAFAVPDQITPNNPGVMVPGWRSDIKMHIDKRTPVVAAFGRIGLPDSGMTSSWPYLDPNLDIDTIIQQQTAEKTDLSGVRIDILRATADIKTAGAVSDISYQLLLRSSPSYLAAHNEIMTAAFERYCEKKFTDALVAHATASGATAPTDAKTWKDFLFGEVIEVEDAIGGLADLVFVSKDLFRGFGGMDLPSQSYGTQNTDGTAQASTLKVNISGIDVRRAPFLPPGTIMVASSAAAKFPTSGPRIATEENVIKLGRDVAVWGMYEDAEVYYPGAIRVTTVA